MRNRTTLFSRLLWAMFPWYVMLACAIIAAQIAFQAYGVIRDIDRDLRSLGITIQPNVVAAVWRKDMPELTWIAEGTRRNRIVSGMRVVSINGEVLFADGDLPAFAVGKPQHSAVPARQTTLPLVHTTPYGGDTPIGELHLYANAGVVWQRVQFSLWGVVLSSLLATTGLWLLFAWVIRYRLSDTVTGIAEAIAAPHFHSAEAPAPAIHYPYADELGELVSALNESRARLVESLREREDMNRNLENTVLQRTQELVHAKDRAETANRAKSQFLAHMSHELRTPLNAILGFSQLMANDATATPDQREQLRIINRSGEHLLAMINDVLDLSKIEAGHVQMALADFRLVHLCDEVIELMRGRANEKSLDLRLHGDFDPALRVRSDPARLHQILVNLLGNAIKFTQHGHIELVCRLLRPGWVRFEVSDTGIGIPADKLNTVFESFTQIDGDGNAGGTGLGLAISQKLANLMGGGLGAESTVGAGSRFWLDIPFDVADSPEHEFEVIARVPVRLSAGQPTWRILAAEDDPASQRLIRSLLSDAGFETRVVANGREAVEQCEAWRPHLVLMDIMMPVVDGLQATREIRVSTYGRTVPIVALTASVFNEEHGPVHEAGCDDILLKPVRVAELLAAIAKHLSVQYSDSRPPSAGETPPPASDPTTLSVEATSLSESVRSAIRTAAQRLDADEIEAQLSELRLLSPLLAEHIAKLANRFDYGAITRLFA